MVKFPEFDMTGRFVLITGAAGLLGQNHCEAILESGATVIATDINLNHLKDLKETNKFKKYDKRFVVKKLNVVDEDEIIGLKDELLLEKMMPCTLVNNAALNPAVSKNGKIANGRLEEFDELSFTKEIEVGLKGYILCCKIFAEEMQKKKFGNIINIASDLAVIAPSQFLYQKKNEQSISANKKPVSYSAIKHAVIGLTKYMATYYCDRGIRCNALSPGGVKVNQDKEFISKIESLIPLGRMANADEYKGAIKYLCSDASLYLNGHNLVVDGGRSVW